MSTQVDDTASGTPEAGPLARGLDQITRPIGRLFRTAPLTCVFLVVFWTAGALTGALGGPNDDLLARVGFGTGSPLWTAFSSALWAMDLMGYVVTTVLLLVFGPLAEREFGALRTAVIFLGVLPAPRRSPAYPDAAALPRIANAVSRAYLPHITPRQGFRLAAKMISRS
ncbi:hypothetical protein [Lentzea sp. NPDC004782]|uniref:hypothetical protein n=1 Tax=Lentzea sp. NPDC004782 TaxID=3154458 RepID=UPI00339E53C8